jgi:hypothetical protein
MLGRGLVAICVEMTDLLPSKQLITVFDWIILSLISMQNTVHISIAGTAISTSGLSIDGSETYKIAGRKSTIG